MSNDEGVHMNKISIEQFGKDHWSTLLYLETRIVDNDGRIERVHMRVDPKRHPMLAHTGSHGTVSPTRLAGGIDLQDHDDYDVCDDLIEAGLLCAEGTGLHPRYALTDAGWDMVGRLRRWRASRRPINEFVHDESTL